MTVSHRRAVGIVVGLRAYDTSSVPHQIWRPLSGTNFLDPYPVFFAHWCAFMEDCIA